MHQISFSSILKFIGKGLGYLLGTVVLIALVFLFIVRINSTGKEPPMTGADGEPIPNSVAIIVDTVLHGAGQRLTIRGTDKHNPVLLLVHGGPGSSFIHPWARNDELEKRFIVCYWDQRGAGPGSRLTSDQEIELSLEKIVQDGISVSEYLLKAFRKEKIYLQGISWGTAVSAFMTKERPDLYHAYLGIGQMGNQPYSEEFSYAYVLAKAQEKGDSIGIRALESIGPPPYADTLAMINAVNTERGYVRKYTPAEWRSMPQSGMTGMMRELLFYPGLSFGEKVNFFTGARDRTAFRILWPTCAHINLMRDVTEYKIPVYMIHGSDDHFTETSIAKMYFDSLRAPSKDWILVEHAGHRPDLAEPDLYLEVIDRIVK